MELSRTAMDQLMELEKREPQKLFEIPYKHFTEEKKYKSTATYFCLHSSVVIIIKQLCIKIVSLERLEASQKR